MEQWIWWCVCLTSKIGIDIKSETGTYLPTYLPTWVEKSIFEDRSITVHSESNWCIFNVAGRIYKNVGSLQTRHSVDIDNNVRQDLSTFFWWRFSGFYFFPSKKIILKRFQTSPSSDSTLPLWPGEPLNFFKKWSIRSLFCLFLSYQQTKITFLQQINVKKGNTVNSK